MVVCGLLCNLVVVRAFQHSAATRACRPTGSGSSKTPRSQHSAQCVPAHPSPRQRVSDRAELLKARPSPAVNSAHAAIRIGAAGRPPASPALHSPQLKFAE